MHLKDILVKIGLTESEAEIYLAVLEKGDCLASTIAKVTGGHRTHIYDTLEKLISKGLVNYVIKENRKYYSTTNPKNLLDSLKEKQEQVEEILPNLLQKFSSSKGEVKIELYKGKEGLKIILRDLVAEAKTLYVFGKARFEELLPEFFIKKIVNEMNAKKIKEFMILEKGQTVVKVKNATYKHISKKYLLPTGALVYNNKVALVIWKKPIYIILIEDEEIAQSYLQHFKLLWKIAKK